MKDKPLVSLITVCYNSEKTIKDTLESILNQTYLNIEYIIVDGQSTDNTLEIIKEYEIKFNGRLKWISEKDSGLYDAMNKGIKLATGNIIGILNSDDFYIDEYVIEDVVNKMLQENVDCLYADLVFVSQKDTNKIIRKWRAGEGKFKLGWNPPHPTVFLKKEVYKKYGFFNTNYKIAADYDILYRFLEKNKVSNTYLNRVIVKMRMGGESTNSFKNILKGNIEIYKTLKYNGEKYRFFIVIVRLIKKIVQLKV